MKIAKLLRNVLAISSLVLLCGTAQAQDWKVTGVFAWLGVGKTFQIEKGHSYWVGEFSGTFINDKGAGSVFHGAGMKCPGFNDLNFNDKKATAGGYCVITDAEGDQAYVLWQGMGDTTSSKGTFMYTGGTGKYKGISGNNSWASPASVNWPDGTVSGHTTFNR